MRNVISILLFLCAVTTSTAQRPRVGDGTSGMRITREYNNVSLSDALRQLNAEATDYEINFLYNELEDFRITTTIRRKTVPDAIRQMIGFYPIRMSIDSTEITVECPQKTANRYKGTIIDELGQPVAYANIALLSPQDSTLITGGVSNESGLFVIPCEQHPVLARISYVGYKTIYKQCNITELGTIRMQPDISMLGEIAVVGTRPVIKREVDRLVFYVGATPLSQGSSVLDLLKQTPLVKITDQSIGIIGKSDVKVMLNGKLSYLSGNDLMQYLRSLQSDDIESIEVITTPPSRYDAGGNGGMLNIVTKSNPDKGLNGTVGTSYTQRSFAGENVNATVNYRTSSTFLSLKLRQNHNKGTVNENYTISQPTKTQASNTKRIDTYNNYGANIVLEQQLSAASTIGAIYDFSYGRDNIDTDNRYSYMSGNTLDSLLTTQLLQKGNTRVHTLNAYYDLKLDTLGKKLGIVANYIHHSPDKNVYFTTLNHANGIKAVVREPNEITYRIWTGEVNLELPFSWLNIETGAKYSDIRNLSDMKYYNLIGNDYVAEPGRCNEFDYNEKTIAGYVSAKRSLNSYFSIQAGLRYEHTFVKGITPHSYVEDVKADYGKLFPTVYLSYIVNPSNMLNINYARRINRPYFRAINPFKWYTNPNNIDEGNPQLKPSYADNVELNYLFRSNLSATIYYQWEDNAYGQMMYVNDDNTTYSTYENIYNNRQFGINLSYNLRMFGWWSTFLTGNYIYNSSEIKADGYFAQNGSSFDFRVNNTISFDKERRFQLFLNYSHNFPYHIGVTYDCSYANFNAGLKGSFLDNNLTVNIYANDIFRQDLVKRKKESVANIQDYNNYYDSRYLRISVVYKWGNRKLKTNSKTVSFKERNRI